MTVRRWTAKSAAARCKRNADRAVEFIRKCSLEWEDVDQFYVDRFEELCRTIEEARDEVIKEIADRLADGEHIGI